MKKTQPTEWDPEDWDGLSEEEALTEDPGAVLELRGTVIAEQTWRGGSWVTVYECKGRFFSQDELETVECDMAPAEFERAGIGQDTYDEINFQRIAPEYMKLLDNKPDAPSA